MPDEYKIEDLYEKNIHSMTFTIFQDAIGAKIFKHKYHGEDVQIKLYIPAGAYNDKGLTRFLNLKNNQLQEIIDNLTMILNISKKVNPSQTEEKPLQEIPIVENTDLEIN